MEKLGGIGKQGWDEKIKDADKCERKDEVRRQNSRKSHDPVSPEPQGQRLKGRCDDHRGQDDEDDVPHIEEENEKEDDQRRPKEGSGRDAYRSVGRKRHRSIITNYSNYTNCSNYSKKC